MNTLVRRILVGRPEFDLSNPEHRTLIGEELISKISEKELSYMINNIIMNKKLIYSSAKIKEHALRSIFGFCISLVGLSFNYDHLDEFMKIGGAAYGIIHFSEVLVNSAIHYVTTKVYLEQLLEQKK